jgi:hypothetical protein
MVRYGINIRETQRILAGSRLLGRAKLQLRNNKVNTSKMPTRPSKRVFLADCLVATPEQQGKYE